MTTLLPQTDDPNPSPDQTVQSQEDAFPGPFVFDTKIDDGGRIVHDRDAPPPTVKHPGSGSSPFVWFSIGVILLVVGTGIVESVSYIGAQFAKSSWLGWLTVMVISSAFSAFAFALYREVSGVLSVTTFYGIRGVFESEKSDVGAAKNAALRWLRSVEGRGIDVSQYRQQILKATSYGAVVQELSSSILLRLDREAEAVGLAAANQIAVVTALCPIGSVDAALFILRGVRLVHEVAVIYGMRPSMLGTYALLRRVMFGATTVVAAQFVSNLMVQDLTANEIISKFVGNVAAAGASWQRMRRVGLVAIASCRILSRPCGRI